MPWFNVDDGFSNSKPVLKIPRRYRCAAIGLWTLAGSWSAKELTDGFIPDEALEEFAGTTSIAAWLVKADLWRKVEGGWQFEGWSKWQKTKEKVLAYREREAEKKRNQRSTPKGAGSESVSPGDSPGTEPSVPEGQVRESPACPAPPLPLPLPEPEVGKDLSDPDGPDDRDPLAHITKDDFPTTFTPIYPKAFEEWWQHYPRKDAKKSALEAWRRACRRASKEDLIAGAIRYANDPNRQPRYTKQPTTWLNGDCWLSDALPAAENSSAVNWEAL